MVLTFEVNGHCVNFSGFFAASFGCFEGIEMRTKPFALRTYELAVVGSFVISYVRGQF